MAQYIFYTHDSFSTAPNGENIKNLKILGIEKGNSKENAVQNLLDNNKWIEVNDFNEDNIKCLAIMKPEILEKINKVIEYLWVDEEKHWEECEYTDDHIFQALKEIKTIL
jgi:hypothetical protein